MRRRTLRTSVGKNHARAIHAAICEVMESRTLLSAADVDPTFGSAGRVTFPTTSTIDIASVATQSDGKTVLETVTSSAGGTTTATVRRLLSNGSLDSSFGTNGVVTLAANLAASSTPNAVVIEPSGKILINEGNDLVQLTSNGSLDSSFGNGTGEVALPDQMVAAGVAVQSDGKIIAVGNTGDSSLEVVRLNTTGTLDDTYGQNGTVVLSNPYIGSEASAVAIDSSGRAVISSSGNIEYYNGSEYDYMGGYTVERLTANGALDTSFGNDGVATGANGSPNQEDVYGYNPIAIAPDGTIYQAENFDFANGDAPTITAFNSSGTMLSYASSVGNGSDGIYSLAVAPTGDLVAAGFADGLADRQITPTAGGAGQVVAEFLPGSDSTNGALSPDTSFNGNGYIILHFTDGQAQDHSDLGYAAAVTPSGQIVVAGSAVGTEYGGYGADEGPDTNINEFTVTQLQGSATLPAGLDSGTVFWDQDDTGVQAPSEPGIAGETLYIDTNNVGHYVSGDPTTTTDANGAYLFTGVPSGAVIVRQELPSGEIQTSPANNLGQHVTSGSNPVVGADFGIQYNDTVSGTVTVNGSGVADVYLDANNNSALDSNEIHTSTDSNGNYVFTDVPPGAYIVRQQLNGQYEQVTPAQNYGNHVTVAAGSSITNQNFTDSPPYNDSISGTVTNSAGAGIAGVTVYLDANNDSTLDNNELSTTTLSNGSYSFSGVPYGAYIVRQILLAGDSQTSPSNGYGNHITVASGSNLSNQNFVDTTGGTVSGTVTTTAGKGVAGITVYLDANNNSKPDSGELTAVTNSSGNYVFANVPAGAYIVRQELPQGDTQVTPAGNYGDHITVSAGQSVTGQNFTDTTSGQLHGTAIGTAGSYKNDGNTIANVFDGNLSTYFDAPTANGNWAGLNLGSAAEVTTIEYAPRAGYESRMVGGIFQASNTADFSSGVVNLYTITSTPADGLTSITVNPGGSYQYYRYLAPNGSYGNIAEMELFD